MEKFRLKKEEKIIIDVIISARKIQEFLWSELNDESGKEELLRMLRKRLIKIESIDLKKPYFKIELKKRLLQLAGICVQTIYKIDQNKFTEGIHPSMPSNLEEYKKE